MSRQKTPERTVELAEYKTNPGATVRRARDEGPVAVMQHGKVVVIVSVPKNPLPERCICKE